MGRPYKTELNAVPQTLDWAANADIAAVTQVVRAIASRPLIVIGSGGSVTACHLLAKLHAEHARQPVRVTTPYEFSLQPPDGTSSVLLLSAGGANRDILRAAEKASTESYESVCAIVARARALSVVCWRNSRTLSPPALTCRLAKTDSSQSTHCSQHLFWSRERTRQSLKTNGSVQRCRGFRRATLMRH